MHYAEIPRAKPNLNKFAKIALIAFLFLGVMGALANVIYTPLKLNATITVTEDEPDPTYRPYYSANVTTFTFGNVSQGDTSPLTPVRITNISTETTGLIIGLETPDIGLDVAAFYPNGEAYGAPCVLAPGEHIDLLVGVSVGYGAIPGPISFKLVFI